MSLSQRGRGGSSAPVVNGHGHGHHGELGDRNQGSSHSLTPAPINGRPAGMSDDDDSDYGDEGFMFSDPSSSRRKTARPRMAERIGSDEKIRLACMEGNVEKVLELLDGGIAEVDETSKASGWSPLMVAASIGGAQLVKVLIDRGANVNFRSAGPGNELTPLMAASLSPGTAVDATKECANLLISAGADVNLANNEGYTPLMYAAKQSNLGLVEALLNAGADVNAVELDAKSALEFAAHCGSGRIIRLLLENNADTTLVNEFGMTAWEVAAEQEHFIVADILYKATATKWRPGLPFELLKESVDWMDIRKYFTPNRAGEVLECNERSQIEMVLENLGMQTHLANFQRHNISYLNFLNLNDEQLKDIGIEAIGDRMKILDAIRDIHNRGWTDQSVTPIYLKPNITASEMICILNNTTKHMEYIITTIEYLRRKATTNPEMLEMGIERNPLAEQLVHTAASLDATAELQTEIKMLHKMLREIESQTEFRVADDISAGRGRFRGKWINILGAMTLTGVGLVFALRYRKV